MNLAFSYTRTDDLEYNRRGYAFLGAGYDSDGVEVHVFDMLKKNPAQEMAKTA
jgi:hypothetical protein